MMMDPEDKEMLQICDALAAWLTSQGISKSMGGYAMQMMLVSILGMDSSSEAEAVRMAKAVGKMLVRDVRRMYRIEHPST